MSEWRNLKALLVRWTTAVADSPDSGPPTYDGPDIALRGFTENSGEAGPGLCFVARVRPTGDGHPYIAAAIAAGASLIVAQRSATDLGLALPAEVVYWQVPDSALTLAWLSAAWHDFPSREMVMIGVTGTNGKTTTVNLLFSVLQAAGLRAGMLSTLRAVIGEEEESLALHVSTPEAPVVQRYLRQMVDAGVTHCILETTSHGLAQHRVTGVDFDVAVMTNLSHEHLDYHGDLEQYYQAKAMLFTAVAGAPSYPQKPVAVQKTAVLNLDDLSYERLSTIRTPVQFSYSSSNPAADMTAANPVTDPWGTYFEIEVNSQTVPKPYDELTLPIQSKLLGAFSIDNMLAAAAAAYALAIEHDIIKAGLEQVERVHGRMHEIQRGQSFIVHVDFAHTPDGLDKAIAAARGILRQTNGDGRVITVFGSAGLRDPEKRRLMAELSAESADLTVLTAEDPRTESLAGILAVMATGCRARGGVENETFWCIPDRGQAIYFALTLAQEDDFVLICGKGHEQSMCFATTEFAWDDVTATYSALAAFLKGKPMPDLGLPTFDPDFDGAKMKIATPRLCAGKTGRGQ